MAELSDEEKKAKMAEMDVAADVAEVELKTMSQHVTVPMARWWNKHFGKAGHKRLGRLMNAHAKAMVGTKPEHWADGDE